jgi:ABC-type transport system involved in multi-copper enzyme maturation permease subunit
VKALVGAEFLKLRTTRGWIGFTASVVVLSAIAAGGLAGTGAAFEIDDPEFQRDLVSGSVVAGLIALMLGITSVTAEWRHGTITRTFLVMPRRVRVLLAKEIAASLAGAALAVLGVIVVLAVAVPVLSGEGAGFELDGPLAARIGRVVLAAALWGAIGVGVGGLLKSQTFALVAAIVWVVVLETLLAALLGLADLDVVADALPGRALSALEGSDEDVLHPALGGLLGLGYAAVLGVLGYVRVARSDIT